MRELELLKEVKEKTLERIIEKFGTGFGDLVNMKLSIWDVREILYKEINIIANREFTKVESNNRIRFKEDF